ncbi:TIGR01244 family sulfur transferase [uncultured Paracoccus sp.]|uniref:TIGR01244 family sulfur transferase n=1 Tax=uncultured Paracoccus sp. TaxID=189685 RepID=UPI00261FCABE|nr:TIGR01244 family sulfur transferase [uncultured Paracoccus sp.]
MDLRQLTPDLAVSPQIQPEDVPELARAGFKVLINNRPDNEVGGRESSAAMQRAAEAAGLAYHYIPFQPGQITPDMVDAFADATAPSAGPAVAYCRSGNRSAVLWGLTQAGLRPAQDILSTAAAAGYDLSGVAPLLGRTRG